MSMAANMINARSETASSKPAFREAIQSRRCLIPADGFYECRGRAEQNNPTVSKSTKARSLHSQEYGIVGKMLGQRTGDLRDSDYYRKLPNHNHPRRMPVILDPDNCDVWLD